MGQTLFASNQIDEIIALARNPNRCMLGTLCLAANNSPMAFQIRAIFTFGVIALIPGRGGFPDWTPPILCVRGGYLIVDEHNFSLRLGALR